MAGINLINNLKALISVRVETVSTNEKITFDSKNKDSKSNYSNSSGNNNEQKYNNDNNNNDYKNNSNNSSKTFSDINE